MQSKWPSIRLHKPCIHSKDPYIYSKEPYIHSTEPYVHSKRPWIHSHKPISCTDENARSISGTRQLMTRAKRSTMTRRVAVRCCIARAAMCKSVISPRPCQTSSDVLQLVSFLSKEPTYTYIYVYVYACIYIYKTTHVYTCMYLYSHTYTCVYIDLGRCLATGLFSKGPMYICIYICIYIYT